ncbi:hypothetical protein L1887_15240 [Cichorium endivia]|nr:hypothetical protein L1887_15240 [Cichorium endivia]
MNSLIARTNGRTMWVSSPGVTNLTSRGTFDRSAVKIGLNYEHVLTTLCTRCYCSLKTATVGKPKTKKSDSKPAAIMEEEKNAFFVVRKGDLIGVYKNLIDCQAQVGSSVCDPPVSVYKGYTMPKESEQYLLTCGLKNALYSIRAMDLTEGLFGRLVPCPFQHPHVSIGESKRIFHEALGSQSARACILEFDGACKGNPGQSGAGAVLRTVDGSLFCRLREGLGVTTNNVAEYRAMILGLRYALSKGFTNIHVVGDSKLVCMQIQGLWRVRNENIMKWYQEAKNLKDQFLFFQISHVLRDLNSDADAQANLAVVLTDGQVQEEEVNESVNMGRMESQSQQSMESSC